MFTAGSRHFKEHIENVEKYLEDNCEGKIDVLQYLHHGRIVRHVWNSLHSSKCG